MSYHPSYQAPTSTQVGSVLRYALVNVHAGQFPELIRVSIIVDHESLDNLPFFTFSTPQFAPRVLEDSGLFSS